MERVLTDKEKEKIINCGAFGYDYEKSAAVLGWSLDELQKLYNEPNSEVKRLYFEGKHKADYVIDCKLFELSQSGDLKALDTFRERTGRMPSAVAKKK